MEDRFAGSEDKYVTTGIFMLLFERMHSLRGMTNVLTELYTDRGRMAYLADRIVEFDVRGHPQHRPALFPGASTAFTFTDDWGTELATFVSPRMWCEFFQPRYARIFEAAHAQGWDVWMHSCGKVNEIIEPLIEIGLDAINLQQPRALGIEEVGRAVRRAHLLRVAVRHPGHAALRGTRGEIEAEARLLLERWAHARGRLCALGLWRRRGHRRAALEERDHARGVPARRSLPAGLMVSGGLEPFRRFDRAPKAGYTLA